MAVNTLVADDSDGIRNAIRMFLKAHTDVLIIGDLQRQARFNAAWQLPEVRFSHRLITTVWGCVFVGELILRISLICHASASR